MLAYDFKRTLSEHFHIISLSKNDCDITSFSSVYSTLSIHKPDVVLNFAAYTNVEHSENLSRKINFEVNAVWVYNLAKATHSLWSDFITLSTDYIFDWLKEDGYVPEDMPNPINSYGMAKYLGEIFAQKENPHAIVLRTSWLYWWLPYRGKLDSPWVFKNFVNTMLQLGEKKSEIQVVNDQFGLPTSCVDLSREIQRIIDSIENFRWKILHFSGNYWNKNGVSWAEFAKDIFSIVNLPVRIIPCSSDQYVTQAKRPKFSILLTGEKVDHFRENSSLQSFLLSEVPR